MLFEQIRNNRLDPGILPEELRSARDPEGRTLLHYSDNPAILSQLLAAGLDPNARDRSGLTPLMRSRSAASNQVLLEAGADVNASDPQGNTVLAHQAGVLIGGIGYCGPDLQALSVLRAAGLHPPSQEQAEVWIAEAHSQACAALENNEACAFENWLRQFYE